MPMFKIIKTTIDTDDILKIINATHCDPFSILGIHKLPSSKPSAYNDFAIRCFIPNAASIKVIDLQGSSYDMSKIHDSGFFEVIVKNKHDFFKYKYEVMDTTKNHFTIIDPYCFLPIIPDVDIYLFNEGTHQKVYEKLGAHLHECEGIQGTLFAVWAPCSMRVSVVGNFNQWDGRRHPMRCRGNSGIWELFIPQVQQGDIYKFEIKTASGELYIKSDPYAFFSEKRPNTASIVYELSNYSWKDSAWMSKRDSESTLNKPVSIYEIHVGSWQKNADPQQEFYTYRELADKLVKYLKYMGYTHVELMPVAEHPFDGSWGYQITGYYSVTSRYGCPEDFMYFVDKCHQNNIGVILDWVPAHFPKDGHGLARFDGTALYEHFDAKQGEHPDWGTHIFNYGRNEVRSFLISNAIFWLEKYHIDGIRVDAVASMLYLDYAKKDGEWIPNEHGSNENNYAIKFIQQLNSAVYFYFPGIMMIAEESTSWPQVSKPPYVGGLGFSFKWNMGWMNDFLRYMSKDPIYRKYEHNLLTFSLVYAFSENFILALSHDEVVHGKSSMIGKMPGDYWQKFANLRLAYGYMYCHPGKKLSFMGNEFGQFIEWNYKNSLDWQLLDYDMHKRLQTYVKTLNELYKQNRSLFELDFVPEGFEWIDSSDTDKSIICFVRKSSTPLDMSIVVCNFTPVCYENYRIGVPAEGNYFEILNSDSEDFGGSNVVNIGNIESYPIPYHGCKYSTILRIPPLGIVLLKSGSSI